MKASDYAKLASSQAAEKAALAYQQAQKSSTPMPAQTPTSSNTSYNNSNYSLGSSYNSPSYSPSTPMPATSYTAAAPNYSKPSTPSYSVPSPASSYNGSANVIGSVSNSNDIYKSYQGIYDSVRSSDPSRNQINTWADNKGNVYDTTSMTPQQIFALSLAKDNNPNAAAILKGMGLDMNGNPLSPSSSRNTSYQSSVPIPAQSPSTSSASYGQSSNYGSSVPMPASSAYVKNPEIDKLSRDQQLAYYAANPNEARNEIARAKDVYNGTRDPLKQQEANQWADMIRQAAGIGMDDATYGNAANSSSTGVYMPQMSQQTTSNTNQLGQNTPATSAMPNNLSQMDRNQINAEAAFRLEQERAALKNSAQTKLSSLKNNANYANQLIKDSRVLENLGFSRNNSPFSGKSDYAAATLERGRQIDDNYRASELSNQLNAIETDLYNFERLAPEKQQALINELTRMEREYGVQIGELTGNFNGQRTLAGQGQDFNQALLSRQQHVNEANYLSEKYGVTVEPKEDYQLMLDQVAGLPTAGQRSAAEKALAEQKSDAWKIVEMLGTVPSYLADLLGVPAGTQTQKAKEAAMDAAYKEGSLRIAQQNADTSAQRANESTTKTESMTKNQLEEYYVTGFDSVPADKRKQALINEKASIVADLGISGYNTLYNMYIDEYGDPK